MQGKHAMDQAGALPPFLIFLQNVFGAANSFMNMIIAQKGRGDFIFYSISSTSRGTYAAAFVPDASFGPPLGWS